LGISRHRLSEITKDHARVTIEIAIRLSKAFGGTAKHWHQMQANHDLALTEQSSDQNKTDVAPKGVDNG